MDQVHLIRIEASIRTLSWIVALSEPVHISLLLCAQI